MARGDSGGFLSEHGVPRQRVLALRPVDPLTPTQLYAASLDGVFKSTNRAGRWDAAANGLPDAVRRRAMR